MMPLRPRILFGDHATQAPAIARFVDHARFDVTFAALDSVDFNAFDCVVPLRVDQIAAARGAGARAVLPSAELVALCDDKLAFNEGVIALGFGDAIPALLPDPPTTYPYIRKSRRGDFGVGCRMVRAPGEDVPIADSFCQHAVAGAVEYVLHLLRIDGRIRYSLCYAYDMGVALGVRGAEQRALSTVPADAGAAYAVCVAILDALGFEGTCCFNYKLEDGRVRILELNPRFGGSLVGEVSAYLEALLEAMRR